MRTIFLIMIGLSVAWSQNIGIVHDTKTGLDWQDNYSNNGDNIKYSNWTEAIAYCEALTLGGYADWRLPNINELKSIIVKTNYNYYSSVRLGFVTIVPVYNYTPEAYTDRDYWSSTTHAKYSNTAVWVMDFGYGFSDIGGKTIGSHYVRCVREGQ